MFTKLTTAMFGPLLLLYYLLFEFDFSLLKSKSNISKKINIKELFFQAVIIALITIVGTIFIIDMQADTYTTGGSSRWLYLITQPFVVFHYFISFFIPYNLSADTDWSLIESVFNWRFIVGISFVVAMLFIAFKAFKEKIYRPIAFGILWFFLALAPTSTLIPFAEVLNDHRMMYPFVGLAFAVVWTLATLFYKYFDLVMNSYWLKNLIISLMAIIIIGHSFGVMNRVEVWDNGKNLWYDVTQKSPKNGRGLMNYGLQLMAEAKYKEALNYYYKAAQLMPYYSYLFTNMAIAQNALDSLPQAEVNFKKAINLAPLSYNGYYFYAIFLRDKNRNDEAVRQFLNVVDLAPQFIFARYALMEQYLNNNQLNNLNDLVKESIKMFPDDITVNYYNNWIINKNNQTQTLEKEAIISGDVKKMIELSMIYYNSGNFEKCVEICTKIIQSHSDNVIAYNNLIAALNNLGRYSESIKYGNQALKIDPENQLLKNNIAAAQKRFDLRNTSIKGMTADQIINLSLLYYNEGMYQECARVCEELVKSKPNNALAYNNICCAYNALGEWEKAIIAGEKALKIDANFQLAKNNVALAKKNLQKKTNE